MIKNGLSVQVKDENGKLIGMTYPKRAKGLLKKGRAQYVNDSEIRLHNALRPTSENEMTEDVYMNNNENIIVDANTGEAVETVNAQQAPQGYIIKHDGNKLFFDAREWSMIGGDNAVGQRTFITDNIHGGLVNVWCFGDWNWNWSQIETKPMHLKKNETYVFTFWLNGGENDIGNETCQLEIRFDDDYENRFVYKLNRNYIMPVKKYKGWELYEIPFNTENNELTTLSFVAMRAPMAITQAKEASAYAELVDDTPDEFADKRPQRHNIIFSDGYPTNTWYSTANPKVLRDGSDGQDYVTSNNGPQEIDLSGAVISQQSLYKLLEKISKGASVNLSGAVIGNDDL